MYLARGQAEIIGGMIVLAVFILSIGIFYTTLIQLSATSTKGFSERARFEAERSVEKIAVNYINGKCILVNQGPIPLTIVRIWSSGNPIEIEPIALGPGGSIYGVQDIDIEDIDVVVTGRGNVVEVKNTCEMLKSRNEERSLSFLTSEQILNHVKTVTGLKRGYLYVKIEKANYAVIYLNRSSNPSEVRWFCSSIDGDKKDFSADAFTKISNPDMDGNNIYEIITVDVEKCSSITRPGNVNEYGFGRGFKGYVNYIFTNLIHIPDGVDTVTIHFKFVADIGEGGEAHEVSVSPIIYLIKNGVSLSSPSTVTVASSGSGIIAISGYAIFPIKAFNLPIAEDETYNMTIRLNIYVDPSVTLSSIRLEYLAITGAYIADPWLK